MGKNKPRGESGESSPEQKEAELVSRILEVCGNKMPREMAGALVCFPEKAAAFIQEQEDAYKIDNRRAWHLQVNYPGKDHAYDMHCTVSEQIASDSEHVRDLLDGTYIGLENIENILSDPNSLEYKIFEKSGFLQADMLEQLKAIEADHQTEGRLYDENHQIREAISALKEKIKLLEEEIMTARRELRQREEGRQPQEEASLLKIKEIRDVQKNAMQALLAKIRKSK